MAASDLVTSGGKGGSQTCDSSQTILLVEDDTFIVDLIENILGTRGYKVLVEDNAQDALATFERIAKKTFCIILDYSIPGMDASRFVSCVQEVDSSAKVILSSGYPKSFIRTDFPLDTVFGFIGKPYEPQKLVAEVERVAEAVSV